jgi:hypothetical protein
MTVTAMTLTPGRSGQGNSWVFGMGQPAFAQQTAAQPTASSENAPAAFSGDAATTAAEPGAALMTPTPALQTPAEQTGVTPVGVTPGAASAATDLTPLPSLTTATPVVLELFTAEGCASCLPADANLSNWAKHRSVLILTYHVDYWDYIGWRDNKADPAFAHRQQGYTTAFGGNIVYTPQLIIAGSEESLGTDRDRLAMALADSRPVARMSPLRLMRDPQGRVFVDLPAATLDKPATVWLITYRRQVETDILAGENAGRHLTAINVVRSVTQLGQWTGNPERLAVPIDRHAGGDLPADAAAIVANQAGYGPVVAATAVAFDSLR